MLFINRYSYPIDTVAFLIIFQFSCLPPYEPIDPDPPDLPPYNAVDISEIIGYWTATKVEYRIGAAYIVDVSEHFPEFTISINEYRG